MKPAAFGCPATQGSHVGLGPGFVDEDQPLGVNPALVLFPLFAPSCDLGTELFGGKNGFIEWPAPIPPTSVMMSVLEKKGTSHDYCDIGNRFGQEQLQPGWA